MTYPSWQSSVRAYLQAFLLVLPLLAQGAYPVGFTWNVNSALDPTATPFQVDAAWEFFGSQQINTAAYPWSGRIPQLASQLPNIYTGTDERGSFVGYKDVTLDKADHRFFIKKYSGRRLLVDTREKRTLGLRWKSPVSGTISIRGYVGRPLFTKLQWSLDICHNGVLTRSFGANGGNVVFAPSDKGGKAAYIFADTAQISPGDYVCLTFTGGTEGNPQDCGETEIELLVCLENTPQLPVSTFTLDKTLSRIPVERRLFGFNLHEEDVSATEEDFWAGALDGGSVRIWDMLGETYPTQAYWNTFSPFLQACNFSLSVVMQHNSFLMNPDQDPENPNDNYLQAYYINAGDNNLLSHMLPNAVAFNKVQAIINIENATPQLTQSRMTVWQAWNEACTTKNGDWLPVYLANYGRDVGNAITALASEPVVVSLPLNDSYGGTSPTGPGWNSNLLTKLAERDTGQQVQFLNFHPYALPRYWGVTAHNSYEGRVAAAAVVKKVYLDPLVSLVSQKETEFGRTWSLIATEWNIHPKTYEDPPYLTGDMAAAIHVAGMMSAFMENGIDGAMIFKLRGNINASPITEADLQLFTLVDWNTSGTPYHKPTAHAFRLFGRFFRGEKMTVVADAANPAFPIEQEDLPEPIAVPEVFALAAYEPGAGIHGNGRTILILVNRHPFLDAPVQLEFEDYPGTLTLTKKILLGSDSPESTVADYHESAPNSALPASSPYETILKPSSILTLLFEE